jgi:hypothetical protein
MSVLEVVGKVVTVKSIGKGFGGRVERVAGKIFAKPIEKIAASHSLAPSFREKKFQTQNRSGTRDFPLREPFTSSSGIVPAISSSLHAMIFVSHHSALAPDGDSKGFSRLVGE